MKEIFCTRYATFKLAKKKPGGEKMTGFTRILHRSEEDVLMTEVTTSGKSNPQGQQCIQADTCYFLLRLINQPRFQPIE